MATNLGIINSSRTSQFGEGIHIHKILLEGARDVKLSSCCYESLNIEDLSILIRIYLLFFEKFGKTSL